MKAICDSSSRSSSRVPSSESSSTTSQRSGGRDCAATALRHLGDVLGLVAHGRDEQDPVLRPAIAVRRERGSGWKARAAHRPPAARPRSAPRRARRPARSPARPARWRSSPLCAQPDEQLRERVEIAAGRIQRRIPRGATGLGQAEGDHRTAGGEVFGDLDHRRAVVQLRAGRRIDADVRRGDQLRDPAMLDLTGELDPLRHAPPREVGAQLAAGRGHRRPGSASPSPGPASPSGRAAPGRRRARPARRRRRDWGRRASLAAASRALARVARRGPLRTMVSRSGRRTPRASAISACERLVNRTAVAVREAGSLARVGEVRPVVRSRTSARTARGTDRGGRRRPSVPSPWRGGRSGTACRAGCGGGSPRRPGSAREGRGRRAARGPRRTRSRNPAIPPEEAGNRYRRTVTPPTRLHRRLPPGARCDDGDLVARRGQRFRLVSHPHVLRVGVVLEQHRDPHAATRAPRRSSSHRASSTRSARELAAWIEAELPDRRAPDPRSAANPDLGSAPSLA